MKILLVEDSKFLRVATERALTTAGYKVISADDGEQASRLAREHAPDLILLDVMLPKMSGPDVLKAFSTDVVDFLRRTLALRLRGQEGHHSQTRG